jgi:hypothetical protein
MASQPPKRGGFRKSVSLFSNRIKETFKPPSSQPSSSGASQSPQSSSVNPPTTGLTADTNAKGALKIPSAARDIGNAAWIGLGTALSVLKDSSDAFPPFKSAVGEFLECIDLFQVSMVTLINMKCLRFGSLGIVCC